MSIEQDIAWAVDPASGRGRPVVSHTPKTTGTEPTLRAYFFERVRPIVEQALASQDRTHWPLIILHFDFKSTERPLLEAVWELRGEYESWLTTPPTNYRRWWNNSWWEVEEGGQAKAGEWTPAKGQRLRALVDRAHRLGYWIRFYTLDGFTRPEDRGWDSSYNFGSRDSVRIRWRVALEAGVDLIATDQYEDLAAVMKAFRQ